MTEFVRNDGVTFLGDDFVAANGNKLSDLQSLFGAKLGEIDNVDFTALATLPLFTVPVGKLFIPLQALALSDIAVDVTGNPSASFGTLEPTFNDWQPDITLSGLGQAGLCYVLPSPPLNPPIFTAFPAGTIFNVKINTAAIGTQLVGRILVYGVILKA